MWGCGDRWMWGMGHGHINQSKCEAVFYISFRSINMPGSPVGFSAMLSHTIRESPAITVAGAYNNIRWGFCRLLLGTQIAANLFVAGYHFGRFFPSLPRFYTPAKRIVHLWVTMVLGWVYFLRNLPLHFVFRMYFPDK